jgi:hypothetical protein
VSHRLASAIRVFPVLMLFSDEDSEHSDYLQDAMSEEEHDWR